MNIYYKLYYKMDVFDLFRKPDAYKNVNTSQTQDTRIDLTETDELENKIDEEKELNEIEEKLKSIELDEKNNNYCV